VTEISGQPSVIRRSTAIRDHLLLITDYRSRFDAELPDQIAPALLIGVRMDSPALSSGD